MHIHTSTLSINGFFWRSGVQCKALTERRMADKN